ncbi:MAG: hypothetical protein ACFB20_02335 [Opitutales bacterium]
MASHFQAVSLALLSAGLATSSQAFVIDDYNIPFFEGFLTSTDRTEFIALNTGDDASLSAARGGFLYAPESDSGTVSSTLFVDPTRQQLLFQNDPGTTLARFALTYELSNWGRPLLDLEAMGLQQLELDITQWGAAPGEGWITIEMYSTNRLESGTTLLQPTVVAVTLTEVETGLLQVPLSAFDQGIDFTEVIQVSVSVFVENPTGDVAFNSVAFAVPEPAETAVVFGLFGLGLVGVRRWRRTRRPNP